MTWVNENIISWRKDMKTSWARKGRKNDDLEAENNVMVKSILSSVAGLKHTKNKKMQAKLKYICK